MKRALSFAGIVIVAFTGPVWLMMTAMLGYALMFSGIELIAVALLVDAFFMNTTTLFPLYTVITVIGLIVVELIKPYTVLA